jgi:uncharacterized protein
MIRAWQLAAAGAVLTAGTGVVAAALLLGEPSGSSAKPPLLEWSDLIPKGQTAGATAGLRGVVSHEQAQQLAAQDNSQPVALRTDLNGKEVRIVGYLVPIGLDGAKIRQFLVAPFLGACIHVPPPPANQLVLTNYKDGLAMTMRLLSDPIVITGTLRTATIEADLGEQGSTPVGYEMDAIHVDFYQQ